MEEHIKQIIREYEADLKRNKRYLAKHRAKTIATRGLWIPVWAFHCFRLHSDTVATKQALQALGAALVKEERREEKGR